MLMFNKPCKSLKISVAAKQPCQGKAHLIPWLWLGKINTKLLWPCSAVEETITQRATGAQLMNNRGAS